eukprot:s291_g2.t1
MADNAFKWAAPRGRCRKNVITGEEEADIPLDERWHVTSERGQRLEFENGAELDDPDASLLADTGFGGAAHLGDYAASSGSNAPSVPEMAAQAGASFKLATQMEASLKSLQQIYDELLKLQAQAATAAKECEIKIEEAILTKFVDATKEDLALNNHVQRAKQPGFNYRGKPAEDSESSDDLFEELLDGISGGASRLIYFGPLQRKSDEQVGGRDRLLERLGRCARGGSGNACRNLHRMLVDDKLSLPVHVSVIDVPIKALKNGRKRTVGWPILRLSDWARYALGRGGQMLLAGHCLEDEMAWRAEFRGFWSRYSLIDPAHPLFSSGIDTSCTIPFMVHGDEGRGRCKHPLLTISFQGVERNLAIEAEENAEKFRLEAQKARQAEQQAKIAEQEALLKLRKAGGSPTGTESPTATPRGLPEIGDDPQLVELKKQLAVQKEEAQKAKDELEKLRALQEPAKQEEVFPEAVKEPVTVVEEEMGLPGAVN